ncbi:hypothetical protein GCM10027093_09330 [Paraburkholderia jirisanensis]
MDDYRPGAEATTVSLSMSGYEAQFVLSGMAVMAAINGWTPDIAVLDINMPGMDGFSVARLLRQHGPTRHVTIVAFTAQDEFAVRAHGIAAGFDGYCKKGATPESLMYLLKQLAC